MDGNGYLDPDEVKTLFVLELNKVYDPNAPEDDLVERNEEMERMREYVYDHMDKDKNSLVSSVLFTILSSSNCGVADREFRRGK